MPRRASQPMLWLRALLACALVCGFSLLPAWQAHAQPARLQELEVQRTADGLLLNARVALDLPAAVADVLQKGIPVHFVAEAELKKERWYWRDKRLARASRHMRLSYQPLTRRWRLGAGAEPSDAAQQDGQGLAQYFDTLDEALAAAGRLSGWLVADAHALDAAGVQTLRFAYWLDAERLPPALQMGHLDRQQWDVRVQRRIDLSEQEGVAP